MEIVEITKIEKVDLTPMKEDLANLKAQLAANKEIPNQQKIDEWNYLNIDSIKQQIDLLKSRIDAIQR